jgi:hypothetical protein
MAINMVKLKNQLYYDPETGVFKWRESGSGRRKNLIAGCVKKKGLNACRRIVFDQKEYTCGQLAWCLMKGEFPNFIIDHKDGDSLNDKWTNLRRGDDCIDQRNAFRQVRNKTGCTGVRLNNGYYLAYIGNGSGRQKYLGCSKDLFEAICIRKAAEVGLNYSILHGTDRP